MDFQDRGMRPSSSTSNTSEPNASAALAGPRAQGSHAGLETRLFLGHQAALT